MYVLGKIAVSNPLSWSSGKGYYKRPSGVVYKKGFLGGLCMQREWDVAVGGLYGNFWE